MVIIVPPSRIHPRSSSCIPSSTALP